MDTWQPCGRRPEGSEHGLPMAGRRASPGRRGPPRPVARQSSAAAASRPGCGDGSRGTGRSARAPSGRASP